MSKILAAATAAALGLALAGCAGKEPPPPVAGPSVAHQAALAEQERQAALTAQHSEALATCWSKLNDNGEPEHLRPSVEACVVGYLAGQEAP